LLKAVVAATEEEASCLIANLVAETTLPCPCDAKRGLRIEGKTFDDRPISIRIDAGAGVLYIDGMTQEEVDSVRQRRCPLRHHHHQPIGPET
jgi:hypothetical protein